MTDDLVRWLCTQLDEDERIARAASGSTVVGEPGSWNSAPGGDEWEASRTDCDEDELLVALRPGLPRPPDVMSGKWGAVVDFKPAFEDPRVSSPLPQFEHAARHDPARVLREIEAKRRILYLAVQLPKVTASTDMFDNNRDAWREVIKQLSVSYTDRPGYREEWRP